MINLIKIIAQNNLTFYNYATGEPTSIYKRTVVKLALAILISTFFSNLSKDLMGLTLTVFSILLGFSFNILFYLMTLNKENVTDLGPSLEAKLKSEKIDNLKQELFYNVSYFNLISIVLILVSLAIFISDNNNLKSLLSLFNSETMLIAQSSLLKAQSVSTKIFTFVFYLTLIECIYTFIRIISRVSYFFEQKIKLQNIDKK